MVTRIFQNDGRRSGPPANKKRDLARNLDFQKRTTVRPPGEQGIGKARWHRDEMEEGSVSGCQVGWAMLIRGSGSSG